MPRIIIVSIFIVSLSFFVPQTTCGCSIRKTISYIPADIAIVVALSDEISNSDYERMIDVIRSLPDSLKMGLNNGECRMAVVITDSNIPTTKVRMTDMEYKIRWLEYRRDEGPTMTRRALESNVAIEFNTSATSVYPDRKAPAKIVILITDGKPMYDDSSAWSNPWQDFVKTEAAAQHLRNSLGVVFYVSYVGDPSVETLYQLKGITGHFSRIFDSRVFLNLVAALNKRMELIDYECDCEIESADCPGAQSETDGYNSTCTGVIKRNCSSSEHLQSPEEIDYPPPISIGVGLTLAFVGGAVAILVMEGIAYIVWKRRTTVKDIGQQDGNRGDAVQNRAYYQHTRRNNDDQAGAGQYVEPLWTDLYECIENA